MAFIDVSNTTTYTPGAWYASHTYTFMQFLTGGGLVAAFGQAHKRMRRAVSPSFSIAQLRRASQVIAQVCVYVKKQTVWKLELQRKKPYFLPFFLLYKDCCVAFGKNGSVS